MKTLQINSANNLTFSITKNRIKTNPNPQKKSGFDYVFIENENHIRESFNQLLKKIPKTSGTLIFSTLPSHLQKPTTISLIRSDENLRETLRLKGINYLKDILSTNLISKLQIQLAYAD